MSADRNLSIGNCFVMLKTTALRPFFGELLKAIYQTDRLNPLPRIVRVHSLVSSPTIFDAPSAASIRYLGNGQIFELSHHLGASCLNTTPFS